MLRPTPVVCDRHRRRLGAGRLCDYAVALAASSCLLQIAGAEGLGSSGSGGVSGVSVSSSSGIISSSSSSSNGVEGACGSLVRVLLYRTVSFEGAKELGFVLRELQDLGFVLRELQDLGFVLRELQDAHCPALLLAA